MRVHYGRNFFSIFAVLDFTPVNKQHKFWGTMFHPVVFEVVVAQHRTLVLCIYRWQLDLRQRAISWSRICQSWEVAVSTSAPMWWEQSLLC